MIDFKPLNDVRCTVGESPVWDARRKVLWYEDIVGKTLYRADPATGSTAHWAFPTEVCSLGIASSGRVLVALSDTVGLFDPDSEDFREIAKVEADNPDTRLNDGKVGPDGAFWVGSMNNTGDPEMAREPANALYRVTADGKVEKKVEGIILPNGLAFSADGRTMFHSDTRGPWIDRWDLDPRTGAISNRKRIAEPQEDVGRPDGGATDMEGCYWSAGISAQRLNRYTRDGELVETVPVPVAGPTMPCFGGVDMQSLFVTNLRAGRKPELLERYPLSGITLHSPSPFVGVQVPFFADA